MSGLSYLRGWILDLYPTQEGMALWIEDQEGQAHCLTDSFPMSFLAAGEAKELAILQREFSRRPEAKLAQTRRRDLFLEEELDLLEVTAPNPIAHQALFQQAYHLAPNLTYYNADLNPAVVYGLERGIFPLAYCSAEIDPRQSSLRRPDRLRAIAAEDSPWNLDYTLPPLRILTLRLGGELRDPSHGHRGVLEIGVPGATYRCRWENPRALLITLRATMYALDPDLILTAWGDSFILPELLHLSQTCNLPLPWNRDASRGPERKRERSYFSYGQVVYRAPSVSLFGRLHVDRQTAFLSEEYGLDGIYELARVTGQPLQQVARTSTGTGISAMQVATAYRNGWLIPYRKREPEAFKTASELIRSDKGGLTFQPDPGLYEEVLELDFTSLYPSLMVKFNLSPETVKKECPTCQPQIVPEIGYPVCHCKTGIVPLTLEPVVARRLALKKLAKGLAPAQSCELAGLGEIPAQPDEHKREAYRRRAVALKWLLVTCFGYLGYKNARFGRIEAHEATTAYGREVLLRAKQIAEDRGYRFLHGLTDSLWVQKPGATNAEHEALAGAISEATGLHIGIEGIYRWLAFLPSRQRAELPVANRYFGLFETGELKIRGIEVRRHDTLPWIRQAEEDMLAILARAHNASEYRARLKEVLAQARVLMSRLHTGQVPIPQLLIANRLSRKPSEYRVNLPVAFAARDLQAHGVHLAAGEQIEYILTSQGGARPYESWSEADHYDADRYGELLIRMLETLAVPAGLQRKAILEHLGNLCQPELIDSRIGKIQLTLSRAARANPVRPERLAPENDY